MAGRRGRDSGDGNRFCTSTHSGRVWMRAGLAFLGKRLLAHLSVDENTLAEISQVMV